MDELRQAREAKQNAARAEAMRIRDAYRELFKTPNGKIVLNDLKRLYMDNQLLASYDPNAALAKAAAHDVVQEIIKKTQPLPDPEIIDGE